MFKSTDLLIELLIAGLLILCAIGLFIFSVLPEASIQEILKALKVQDNRWILGVLAIPALALAYAMGVISETVSRYMFEWWLESIKQKRLAKYFMDNHALLSQTPLFAKYADIDPQKVTKVTIDDDQMTGKMRFFVMMKNDKLHREIEGQLNQLRVTRVLFVFLVITFFSLVISVMRLCFNRQSGALSVALIALLVVTIVFSAANLKAIYDRFNRYCRAVERSYLVLLMDESSKTEPG